MENRQNGLTPEQRVQQIMEQFGVSRDAARLLFTIESGEALVNDRMSLGPDDRLDPDIEEELERRQQERLSRTTGG
jgi:hypothetical protein